MEEQAEGVQLGIVVVYDTPSSYIDIVAVHGLGAAPEWAWVRKVMRNGEERKVNWLADKDLLPSVVPNARIMTFNYESKWHNGAPWTRRSLCALQLLTDLNNKRKERDDNENRPIIFIGHSFGGIVIEEAINVVNSYPPQDRHLSFSTAGIIFLGTPHRGTKASKWGELIATSGKMLGYNTEDSILEDLREDSTALADVLHQFSLWLFRFSVPTVCFFEQYETDYGKRIGLSWKHMVVNERSGCIDGHRKLPLPTDHFKINKFEGPDDISYKRVSSVIAEMAKEAKAKVEARLYPRMIQTDNSIVPDRNLECLQSLFLTNPVDDLAKIHRTKGQSIDGTCEWLLVHEDYTAWSERDDSNSLLRLIGRPGIGKTMISSFLAHELEQKAEMKPSMTLAYYFCDNKDEKRNTGLAILRGLLSQLLRQRPNLFKHIQPDYDQQQQSLVTNIDALWRILKQMLEDAKAGDVYLLIDALDECRKSTRKEFLAPLATLLGSLRPTKGRLKILITSRPESDIQEYLSELEIQLQVDSGKVNKDLGKFIDVKVDELSNKKNYSSKLTEQVRSTLTTHAGGTFLWASLVLKGLEETKIKSQVPAKLRSLPADINEVYSRILDEVEPDCQDTAKIVLRWIIGARRPLTVEELATAVALHYHDEEGTVPSNDDISEFEDVFESCGSLVNLDPTTNTLNLVHQSAKEFFIGNYLLGNPLSEYWISEDKAQLFIFEACWKYLSAEEFEYGFNIIQRDGDYLHEVNMSDDYSFYKLLQYTTEEWKEHAASATHAISTDLDWEGLNLTSVTTLRDSWLIIAATRGLEVEVRELLEKGNAQPNSREYMEYPFEKGTPLSNAAQGGYLEVVRLLLAAPGIEVNSKDKSCQTPLSYAAQNGYNEVVQLLLTTPGIDVNFPDFYGHTPLMFAAENGYEEVVQLLLAAPSIKINSKNFPGRTALSYAASWGHSEVARLLLAVPGIEVNSKDNTGQAPLSIAASWGRSEVVQLLLAVPGIEVNSKDNTGLTPLSHAADNGHDEVVQLLLEVPGIEVNSKNAISRTPLSYAAEKGYLEVVQLFLAGHGVEVNSEDGTLLLAVPSIEVSSKNYVGWTALSYAASWGHPEVVQLLLTAPGIEVNSKDNAGWTPLSHVAESGRNEIAKLLLEAPGIEVNPKDNTGRTPLSHTAENGYNEVAQLLLEVPGIEVNSRDNNGQTPLSHAAENGHDEIVKLLLEVPGIDVNSKDNTGQTPLSYAAKNGYDEVVWLLLAVPDIDANSKDNTGQTALSYGALHQHKEVVRLLLEVPGIEVNSKDTTSQALLSYAAENGYKEVFPLLLIIPRIEINLKGVLS
ncbi:hypothetical protein BP6252_08969 [Coleophoma cylindrospora]|uniref:NACHT domain-containing protein n=1 Tax=Coleophoma cylindrospora TaxID=1849047 RepID=A0A3D8R0J2_9HELO|nr:hypothetical protein BP6252_08969 [Coleophoma cylindrospora]